MKIALLSRWYAEEDRRHGATGGGMVRQLAEAVAALGHEVVVLSQSKEAHALEKSRIGALEVWLSPREKKRNFLTGLRDKWAKQTYRHRKVYSDALALRDFLVQRGPFDVLWAQAEEPDGLVAAIAAQMGVPLPPTLVQIQALRYRFVDGAPDFNEKPALGLSFRHATRVLANSQLVANRLSHYAGANLTAAELLDKTRIVHPNLQCQFLQAAAEVDLKEPLPEPPRVLFLGALNEGKGALTFLEAAEKTQAGKKGAHFIIIGDFTEKNPDFEARWKIAVEAAQSGLDGAQLELLGKVPPAEVVHQVRHARVVVLPSLFDAFSRALIEALILGRPVVTTNRVGAWPLVEQYQCGLVVAANDSDALARAIDAVMDPAAPYASNAQQLAPRLRDDFSPETIARQVAQHLGEIADH